MKRFICGLSLLASLFISSFFLCGNVSAMSFGNSGTYGLNSGGSYLTYMTGGGSQDVNFYNVGYGLEIIPPSIDQGRRVGAMVLKPNASIPAHTIFNVSGLVCGSDVNTSYNGFSGGSNFAIIEQNSTATDGACLAFSVTGVTGNSSVATLKFGYDDNSGAYLWFFGSGAKLAVNPVSWVRIVEDSYPSSPDYSSDLSAVIDGLNTLRLQNNDIYNMLTNLNNAQNISNARLDTLRIQNNDIYNAITNLGSTQSVTNQKLDSLNDKQQQANDDANARYEDEKNEINNSKDEAQASADSMDFSFNVLNPVGPILESFSDGCSVPIPNLASWLHSPITTYTSWWCSSPRLQSIRTAVTVTISGISYIVIFSFIYKWLGKGDS